MTYKKFKLEDIFTSSSGDTDIQKNHINNKGYYVVSSGESNFGIIGKTDIEAKIFSKDTITIDMFGNVYYRDTEYKMATHARVFSLAPNGFEMNEKIGLYLKTILSKLTSTFSYNDMCSWNKIKNFEIELPVRETEVIDFDYMNSLISELEQERISELDTYLKVTGLNDYTLTEKEKNILNTTVKYKSFLMGDLFDAETGDVDLQQKDIDGSGEYFINSGVQNNGIKGKTTKKAKIFPANTITIDFFGNVYYRNFQYKMATHNHVFSLSGAIIKNELVGQYLVAQMRYLSKIFTFNEMGTWTKIKNMKISLPVKNDDNIDFDFMESYIRAIEKQIIKDVVEYKKLIIDKTKEVVEGAVVCQK